jgi:hypothetical protein
VELASLEEFTDMLRKSFFVSLYSLLESQMEDECRARRQARNDIRLSLGDLSGKGIDRAKRYLTKVLGVSSIFGTSEWQRIKKYNLLRNCIVHNEGRLQGFGGQKDLREYINDNQQKLSLRKWLGQEEVVLSKEFCKEAVNAIDRFLQELKQV